MRTGLGCHGNGIRTRRRQWQFNGVRMVSEQLPTETFAPSCPCPQLKVYEQFNGGKSHFSSVPTQRPAVAGVLHAALAHGNAALVGPHSPRQGGSSEAEVRMLQHMGDTHNLMNNYLSLLLF